jgi:hypothetical protein
MNIDKKFWEELIAYIPLLRDGPHRKQKNEGDTQTKCNNRAHTQTHGQEGDLISLLTKIKMTCRRTDRQQIDLVTVLLLFFFSK